MRRANIVCTLGPASSAPERLVELVQAGMDVARLNMSHGSYADHETNYRLVRQMSDESGHGVGIFADLQGPKIRLERFADGPVKLEPNLIRSPPQRRTKVETRRRFIISIAVVEADQPVTGHL